jgi:hypothetical protein
LGAVTNAKFLLLSQPLQVSTEPALHPVSLLPQEKLPPLLLLLLLLPPRGLRCCAVTWLDVLAAASPVLLLLPPKDEDSPLTTAAVPSCAAVSKLMPMLLLLLLLLTGSAGAAVAIAASCASAGGGCSCRTLLVSTGTPALLLLVTDSCFRPRVEEGGLRLTYAQKLQPLLTVAQSGLHTPPEAAKADPHSSSSSGRPFLMVFNCL